MKSDPKETLDLEIYSDQFSGSTRVTRRNLLIAASMSLVISIPDLKLKTFFGLDLENQLTFDIALGALTVVVLYEFVSFMTSAWIDRRRWLLRATTAVHKYAAESLAKTSEGVRQTQDQLRFIRSKMTSDEDSVVEAIKSQSGVIDRIVFAAEEEMKSYKEKSEELAKSVRHHNSVQWFRIYFLDWGVPLILGSLALSYSCWRVLVLFRAMGFWIAAEQGVEHRLVTLAALALPAG